MAKIQWAKAGRGLEYYSHNSRKVGVRFDRYFRARYTVDKKTRTVSFGWESEYLAAQRSKQKQEGGKVLSFVDHVKGELARLKGNATKGQGPVTLKEDRALAEAQAKAEARARMQEENRNITFEQYFTETYYPISKVSKKPSSHSRELSHFNLWLRPVIGDMRLIDIRPLHLERVKKNMLDAAAICRKKEPQKEDLKKKQSRSPRSIQYCFATGRQCWNMARRDGLVLGEWPGGEVKLPKVENQRLRFLSDEEGDALLTELKGRSQQLHDICLLSFDSGLRADEAFSLTWNRVDLVQKSAKVIDSKGRDRVVFLTDRAVEMMLSLPQDEGLVFKSRTGDKIKEISNSFDRAVDELGYNAGVKNRKDKLVFHSMRHSFASRLVERGVDLYVVSQLLGHSDLSMTRRYAHLKPDTLKAAVTVLNQKPQERAGKVVELRKKSEKA